MESSKTWLVEIQLLQHEPCPKNKSRTITYEEVVANEKEIALLLAMEQFHSRSLYESKMRRKMQEYGITSHCCYSSDAIEV